MPRYAPPPSVGVSGASRSVARSGFMGSEESGSLSRVASVSGLFPSIRAASPPSPNNDKRSISVEPTFLVMACDQTHASLEFDRWTSTFCARAASSVRRTTGTGRPRPQSRRVLGLRWCFSAQRAELSCRFRAVWAWIVVLRKTVAVEGGGWWSGRRVALRR